MRSAWLDFLGTSCRQRPILRVLEDLQWGDLPSITFLDTALSELGDAPLFVLGLARPDVFDVLPSLFARREPHEVRLGPLKKSAALALAREVLGDDFDAARLERAAELADGNAFFLEELLRALSEGESELLETVLDPAVPARPVGRRSSARPARGLGFRQPILVRRREGRAGSRRRRPVPLDGARRAGAEGAHQPATESEPRR
ncbi:MAG: hypothetical protein U0263_17735 [Polyangiaceae bacterium]